MTTVRHDCKWTSSVLLRISEILNRHEVSGNIHDPRAGIGHNVDIYIAAPSRTITGTEIEPEWADTQPWIKQGDALDYDSYPDRLRCIFTSIDYGNRMAGGHVGTKCQHCEGAGCDKCNFLGDDRDRRHGYAPSLGRAPSEGSSAKHTFGKKWRDHMSDWLSVCAHVTDLGTETALIINVKDSYRTRKTGGEQERMYVTDWIIRTATSVGFVLAEAHSVQVTGNSRGQNGDARLPFESVLVFDFPRIDR